MIIKNKRNAMVEFGSIKNGDVFILHGEEICIKIESTFCDDDGYYENTVKLANGDLCYCKDNIMVQPVQCELVID